MRQPDTLVVLRGWILLFQVFHLSYACQPPDYPEGGSYKPENSKYLPGDRIAYSCQSGLSRIGKELRVCQTTGKWSGTTPFCDSPTKLKNPSASSDPNKEVANVVDNSPSTCYCSRNITGQNLRVYLDVPAPVNVVRIYLQKGRVNFKILTVQRKHGTVSSICSSYDRDIEEKQWVTLECKDNALVADYLVIQDISDKPNALAICEIEAYVRDDVWCQNPPNYFIPNGHLQVSRDKASLRCAEGYRALESTRLVCEKNSWTGPNLQCEEILCDSAVGNESTGFNGEWLLQNSKARKLSVGIQRQLKCYSGFHVIGRPDVVTCLKSGSWSITTATCAETEKEKASSFKTLAISVGAAVAVLILFLLGLTLYLFQKKRSREVVVIYKPGEDGYVSPSFCSNGTEAEYSTVYYDAIHKGPYPPPMTPSSRPPHLRPTLGSEYCKPMDDSDSANQKQRPADIAFGTLKSSALYDTME